MRRRKSSNVGRIFDGLIWAVVIAFCLVFAWVVTTDRTKPPLLRPLHDVVG
jgi:hypothetical protein